MDIRGGHGGSEREGSGQERGEETLQTSSGGRSARTLRCADAKGASRSGDRLLQISRVIRSKD